MMAADGSLFPSDQLLLIDDSSSEEHSGVMFHCSVNVLPCACRVHNLGGEASKEGWSFVEASTCNLT